MAGARILWCAQLIFGLGLIFLESAQAKETKSCNEYPDIDKYEYHLRGNDGFKYRIIESEESIRCLDEQGRAFIIFPFLDPADGSPLYEGWRFEEGGETTKVTISLKKLFHQSRLEGMKASPWAPGRRKVGLFVGHHSFLEALRELQSQASGDESQFAGAKAKLLQEILFEEEIRLDFETLKGLGRVASRPEPPPIGFEFPLRYFASSLIFEDRIYFQVNEIRMSVASRSITFDPARDRIIVSLESDGVRLKGPVRNELDIIPLLTDVSVRLPQKDPYLEEGRIDFARIDFELELDKTAADLWSLALAPGTFVFSFSPPADSMADEPANKKPLFFYNATYELPDGTRKKFDPGDFIPFVKPVPEGEDPSKAIDEDEIDVQSRLQEVFESSITQRIFAQSLAFGLPFLKQVDSPMSFQFADWDIRSDGLMVYYDFIGTRQEPDACVLSEEAFVSRPLSSAELPELDPEPEPQAWSLDWSLDSPDLWTLETSHTSQAEPQLRLMSSLGATNDLLFELWRQGAFCWSTADWEARPAQLPPIELAALRSPSFSVLFDRLSFDIEASLKLFRRNFDLNNEKYVFKQKLDFFSSWTLEWAEPTEQGSDLVFEQTDFGLLEDRRSVESAELKEQSELLILQAQPLIDRLVTRESEGKLRLFEVKLEELLQKELGLEDLRFESWGWSADRPNELQLELGLDIAKGLQKVSQVFVNQTAEQEEVANEGEGSSSEVSPLLAEITQPRPYARYKDEALSLSWQLTQGDFTAQNFYWRQGFRSSNDSIVDWSAWREVTSLEPIPLALHKTGEYGLELAWAMDPGDTKKQLDSVWLFYESTTVLPEARPRLETVLLSERPAYEFYSSRIAFEWAQSPALEEIEGPIFYTYSLEWQDEASLESRPAWSSWAKETSKEFILTKPGRYRFRVKAMTADFQIESGPGLEVSFYYKGDPIRGEGAGIDRAKNEWEDAQVSSDRPSTIEPARVVEVQPANSRGPFGCRASRSGSPFEVFILILSLFVAGRSLWTGSRCPKSSCSGQ